MGRITLLLTLIALAACASMSPQSHTPRLSIEQAISIANHAAEVEKIDLAKFRSPDAHFEYVQKDWSWSVFYIGITPQPGNHFLVLIDDRSGDTRMAHGL